MHVSAKNQSYSLRVDLLTKANWFCWQEDDSLLFLLKASCCHQHSGWSHCCWMNSRAFSRTIVENLYRLLFFVLKCRRFPHTIVGFFCVFHIYSNHFNIWKPEKLRSEILAPEDARISSPLIILSIHTVLFRPDSHMTLSLKFKIQTQPHCS